MRPSSNASDAADQVEPPDPRHLVADEIDDLVPRDSSVAQPRARGAHVVLAHRLDVANLEAGVFDQADSLTDRSHVHVGRDVRLDERAAARRGTRRGHLLHEQTTFRSSRRWSVAVNIG